MAEAVALQESTEAQTNPPTGAGQEEVKAELAQEARTPQRSFSLHFATTRQVYMVTCRVVAAHTHNIAITIKGKGAVVNHTIDHL